MGQMRTTKLATPALDGAGKDTIVMNQGSAKWKQPYLPWLQPYVAEFSEAKLAKILQGKGLVPCTRHG